MFVECTLLIDGILNVINLLITPFLNAQTLDCQQRWEALLALYKKFRAANEQRSGAAASADPTWTHWAPMHSFLSGATAMPTL